MKKHNLQQLILVALVAIFYGNTLTLDYALDDRMVILESKYTLKGGWESAKAIFSEDTFRGYFGNENNVVAGGRYRPMSQLTFMLEFQLFGQDIKSHLGDLDDFRNLHDSDHEKYFNGSTLAVVNHLMNVLYFMLLCLITFEVLSKLFSKFEGTKWYQSLAFVAVVLFALHPIHTEAVANVKGRDEIFAMLGAMAALWCALLYVDTRKWWMLLLELVAILFALFSKENAITFLAVVPLALFFYQGAEKRSMDYVVTLLPILLSSVFFMVVRAHVLGGMMPEDTTHNILNNPYIHSSKAQEIATVLLTWGIYLKLLVFPHPLTHDYYPNQIAITDFSNPLVWVILIAVLALILLACVQLRKKTVISFAILFFVITFSITSNLLFNVGTFMNERFVFIPSLGFVLALAYGWYCLQNNNTVLSKGALVLLLLVVGLYGGKTFARNLVWNDDFTLFLTDVKTSENSIKCNISAGGSALQLWKAHHKERDKQAAYRYLDKAMKLDDHSLNAYLLLGELMFLDGNTPGALQAYKNATLIDPNNALAQENLAKMMLASEDDQVKPITQLLDEGMAQRDAAKINEAYRLVNEYLEQHPESLIGQNVRGNILGRGMGRLDEAIAIYERIVAQDETFASAWENMGIAYAIQRKFDKAEQCLQTALKYAPDNDNIRRNIEMMQKDRASSK